MPLMSRGAISADNPWEIYTGTTQQFVRLAAFDFDDPVGLFRATGKFAVASLARAKDCWGLKLRTLKGTAFRLAAHRRVIFARCSLVLS